MPQRLLFNVIAVSVLLLYVSVPLTGLAAQTGDIITDTLQTGPIRDDPIVPKKTPATPTPNIPYVAKLEIVRYYTKPAQVRAREPFELYLEIKNIGAAPAVNWFISGGNCPGEQFLFIDTCTKSIPALPYNESTTSTIRLQFVQDFPSGFENGLTKELKIQIFQEGYSENVSNPKIFIVVLPPWPITDEEINDVKRTLARPKLVLHRTWTAKARARVEELLTEVPLRIDTTPAGANLGGPEFEVVVEVQNQGSERAHNIYIDFCSNNDHFNPVYAGCRKAIPITLGPGESAIASQTMAYQNKPANAETPVSRGDTVAITITYEFEHKGEWLREELTDQQIYLYPQPFPALTPIPILTTTASGLVPDLVVNTPQLNVRGGPGTNFSVFGVTYQGVRFEVKAKCLAPGNVLWWQINYNGVDAWVYGDFVIARGVGNVPDIPYDQIPKPPPLPTPAFTPNPNPVSGLETQPTTLPVAFVPTPSPAVVITPAPLVPLAGTLAEHDSNWLAVSEQSVTDQTLDHVINRIGVEPLVVIDSYQTSPTQLQPGEPFHLEVVLRNAGVAPAQQLLLSWQGSEIIPVGAGTIRALPDLAAGAAITIQGDFVLNRRQPEALIQLPVQIVYADTTGQFVTYVEQMTLLHQATSVVAGLSEAEPGAAVTTADRPLWLRVLSGIFGLGAE